MNINIPQLYESMNKSPLNGGDLFNYIDTVFPDNPKNWNQATLEIVDMANWIYEVISEEQSQELAEPLKDIQKSKKPSEWNMKHKNRIKTGFVMLNNFQQKRFFEEFGHWIQSWKDGITTLNESQEIKIEDEKEIESVMRFKQKQFLFDNGLFMATIKSNVETKFGLLWHALTTTDVDSFIDSVSEFIKTSNETLSELDIERLTNHYNKYYLN